MYRTHVLALILLLVSSCACSLKHGVNYQVGPECHPTADLVGCDPASPPSCRAIALHYDRNCEKLVATQVTK